MTVIIQRMSDEMRARRIRMGMIPAPVAPPPDLATVLSKYRAIPVAPLRPPPPVIRATKAQRIMRRICRMYSITKAELCGQCRHARLVRARQDYCYLMRRLTLFTLPQIARMLGDRDHTSVYHAIKRCCERRGRPYAFPDGSSMAKREQRTGSPATLNTGPQVSFQEAAE